MQTLFYGVFSAWVVWHESRPAPGAHFDLWRDSRRLQIPIIRVLFEQFSASSNLPSGLEPVLGWTADALNRVDRAAFFARFGVGDAVQYFYEPFLEAFDPDLRRQLGVWYTPREIVQYMVAQVDHALKTDLGIADGLADDSVIILDPCCGTGAFLVETLRHIHTAQTAQVGAALAGAKTAEALHRRVFGFELMPAPLVIAHLQLATTLHGLGGALPAGARAGVLLTNALTGWNEARREPLALPDLEAERRQSDEVKQKKSILVVLGNPPYNGYAGTSVAEEAQLVEPYRTVRGTGLPQPNGQGLNDLYVRFYRMAERRIAETTGRGVVSFISNYSWLDGLSHVGMRERYLHAFDRILIDNLHGDRIIGERAPDGATSETVFAMHGQSAGIRVGTAVATMIRREDHQSPGTVYYRDFDQARASARRAAMLDSVKKPDAYPYTPLTPVPLLGLPFKPRTVLASYLDSPRLNELFPTSFPGVKTSRDADLVSIDRDRLVARMERYFDPNLSDEAVRVHAPALMKAGARYNPTDTRKTLVARGFLPGHIVRFAYRPFDVRWLYWEPKTNLLDRNRADYFPHVQPGNVWLASAETARRGWNPTQIATALGCLHVEERGGNFFPLYLYEAAQALGGGNTVRRPNLSKTATEYLYGLGYARNPATGYPEDAAAEALFYHALAVMHAPAYREANAGALRQDWPRIPLPATRDALEASAGLGRAAAALLDAETPVPGVSHGVPRPELAGVAVLATTGGSATQGGGPADLAVRAGWGYLASGAVMPGQGRTTPGAAPDTVEVWLNDTTYWGGVPAAVWAYTLGGYPVLKKWLSYREHALLGRPLGADEAAAFTGTARRIAALLALGPSLDAAYAGTA
jgi:predicted helicase